MTRNQFINDCKPDKTSQNGRLNFLSHPASLHGQQQRNTDDPVITLRDIAVQYGDDKPLVLNMEELKIVEGERVALIGPSGAGKTTLLRLLNGYVQPSRGQVNLLGNQMNLDSSQPYRDYWTRAMRRQVGFVFQDFSLVERATVFQNVLWGRLGQVNPLWSLLGWFSAAHKMAAMTAIAEVDLLPQVNQRVDTLSGGQQQRVGIARVLAQEAEVILADEPVSNLDPVLADDILSLLSDVSQRHRATLIMSLHQPLLAQRYADRIVGLRAGCVVYNERVEHFNDAAIQDIYGRKIYMDTATVGKLAPAHPPYIAPTVIHATP